MDLFFFSPTDARLLARVRYGGVHLAASASAATEACAMATEALAAAAAPAAAPGAAAAARSAYGISRGRALRCRAQQRHLCNSTNRCAAPTREYRSTSGEASLGRTSSYTTRAKYASLGRPISKYDSPWTAARAAGGCKCGNASALHTMSRIRWRHAQSQVWRVDMPGWQTYSLVHCAARVVNYVFTLL